MPYVPRTPNNPYLTRSLYAQDAPVTIPGYGRVPVGLVPAEVYDEHQARQTAAARSEAENARQARIFRRWLMGTAAGVGGIVAGPAIASMFTGGGGPAAGGAASAGSAAGSGAAGAGWSMPGVTAPVFGSGAATGAAGASATAGGAAGTAATAGRLANIGRMFNSPGMELGVNAAMTGVGMISQNRAANQARADMLAQQREALALERQRLELEARNADLDREDARALNTAINALKERELAAAEEERAFRREQDVYMRGKDEAREARMGPYREASEAALGRLRSMWGV